MTLATLVVKIEASTSQFHREMETSARHIEQVGKRIQRAGMEISTAISLPILAVGLAAFAAALDESQRHFGPLATAFDMLKARVHDLFLAIGNQLLPTFMQIIGTRGGLIDWLTSMVEAFGRLSPAVQKAIISTLLFLVALGPAIVIIGKFVKVFGAIPALIAAATSPIGLLVIALGLLAGAAIYLVTHWDHMGRQLTLVWTMIEEAVFGAISGIMGALSWLLDGGMDHVFSDMRKSFDAWSDSVLASQAAKILANDLEETNKKLKTHGTLLLSVRNAIDAYNNDIRTLNANQAVFGSEFNKNAASAAALKKQLDSIIAAGPAAIAQFEKLYGTLAQNGVVLLHLTEQDKRYEEALSLLGPSLADHARLLKAAADMGINLDTVTERQMLRLRAYAAELTDTSQAISTGLVDAFTALGNQLGGILAGVSHGFAGLGKAIEGVVGTMLTTIGQALIAFGTAGIAIQHFITNPYTAIAAGIALIALGSALSHVAQSAVTAGGAGGAGGGTSAPSAASAPAAAEPQGTGTINIYGDPYLDMSNPMVRDRLANALKDLAGYRQIEINWKPA